jgi:hypothetical protein
MEQSYLGRTMRLAVTANLVLAISSMLACMGYDAWRGVPDRNHLKNLVYAGVLLYLFLTRRRQFRGWTNEMVLRGIGILQGVFGFVFAFVIPRLQAQVYGEPFGSPASALDKYWLASVFAYGLVGSVRPSPRPADFRPKAEARSPGGVRRDERKPVVPGTSAEDAARRFSYVEEFQEAQARTRRPIWMGMIVLLLIAAATAGFLQFGSVGERGFRPWWMAGAVVLVLALLPVGCWLTATRRAAAVCPHCKQSVLECPPVHCRVCGELLKQGRCERCLVDENWTSILHPMSESSGNYERIRYCPGCGVWLNSNLRLARGD